MNPEILFMVLSVLMFVVVLVSIRVDPQGHKYLVERLGVYHEVKGPGLHFIMPFIDRVKAKIPISEQVSETKKHEYLMQDNDKINLKIKVFYLVDSPRLFVYGVKNPDKAISHFVCEDLKKVLYSMYAYQFGESIYDIEKKVFDNIAEVSKAWGIQVSRVSVEKV